MSMPVLLTLPLGLDNGLGRLPPLTFSVWNFFGLHANESVVLETAANAPVPTHTAAGVFRM